MMETALKVDTRQEGISRLSFLGRSLNIKRPGFLRHTAAISRIGERLVLSPNEVVHDMFIIIKYKTI